MMDDDENAGSSDFIGKSRWREILSQAKVQKAEEYFVYFQLYELHDLRQKIRQLPQTMESEIPIKITRRG